MMHSYPVVQMLARVCNTCHCGLSRVMAVTGHVYLKMASGSCEPPAHAVQAEHHGSEVHDGCNSNYLTCCIQAVASRERVEALKMDLERVRLQKLLPGLSQGAVLNLQPVSDPREAALQADLAQVR